MRRFLPEWHPQWGVLLAWPDQDTDWADHLADAEQCYLDILAALLDHQHVLLVCRNEAMQSRITRLVDQRGIARERLTLIVTDYNDTWARDFGPLAVEQDGQVEFGGFWSLGRVRPHHLSRCGTANHYLSIQIAEDHVVDTTQRTTFGRISRSLPCC